MLIILRGTIVFCEIPLGHMIPTGCNSLDKVLGGGLSTGGVSLIYGEAETGKSTLAIQCAVNCARMGYKSLFIDSDRTFSPQRLLQIAYHDYGGISPLIILVQPSTFQEQINVMDHLEEYLTKKVGLILIDTITSLYRLEFGNPKEIFTLNRELNRQVALLSQITKTYKTSTVITSQVRSTFLGEQYSMEPVATRILKFWSEVVLNLKHTGRTRIINAVVEKNFNHESSENVYIKIDGDGIHG